MPTFIEVFKFDDWQKGTIVTSFVVGCASPNDSINAACHIGKTTPNPAERHAFFISLPWLFLIPSGLVYLTMLHAFALAGCFGGTSSSFVARKYGRRTALAAASFIFTGGGLLQVRCS
eukprot:SAG11_NODE_1611_length_4583_cov_3.380687_2_plen_118_part_00